MADSQEKETQKEKQVTVLREGMNVTLALALTRIGENPAMYWEDVKAGILEHHAFYMDGQYAYSVLLRVDENRDGSRDLVCIHGIAAAGTTGGNVRTVVHPYLVAIAKKAGLNRVRMHTQKKAMERVFEAEGYKRFEAVYTFEVQ